MVSSEPPLTHLGNSTRLLDIEVPKNQVMVPPPVIEFGAEPLDSRPWTLERNDPLLLAREHDLDNINNMHMARNERWAERCRHEINVLGDKPIMGMDDYMTSVPISVEGPNEPELAQMPSASPGGPSQPLPMSLH